MTGFGRASEKSGELYITSEVRSVNNRYLETSIKLPRHLAGFETRAREILGSRINRGRIYLTISDLSTHTRLEEVKLDMNLCRAAADDLRKVAKELQLNGEIKLEHILHFAEHLTSEKEWDIPDRLLQLAENALMKSVEQLNEMREQEGEHLRRDLYERLHNLKKSIAQISVLAENNAQIKLNKLKERIALLADTKELDPGRMEMEAALLVDKVDITEELVRLHSHFEMFDDLLQSGSPCGRKITFIIQEINRELNTASAKSGLPEVSHLVVDMKEELERMREQVQNVE